MIGRIDAAILYDTFETPLINKRTILTEELFLIGADDRATSVMKQDDEIPLRNIARYPLVIPGRMHAIRRMVESLAAEQGVKLTIELEVGRGDVDSRFRE